MELPRSSIDLFFNLTDSEFQCIVFHASVFVAWIREYNAHERPKCRVLRSSFPGESHWRACWGVLLRSSYCFAILRLDSSGSCGSTVWTGRWHALGVGYSSRGLTCSTAFHLDSRPPTRGLSPVPILQVRERGWEWLNGLPRVTQQVARSLISEPEFFPPCCAMK